MRLNAAGGSLFGISIREAEQSDISAIMELESLSFDEDIMEEESVFLDRISSGSSTNYVLCGEDSQVVGSFFSEIWCDEPEDFETAFRLGHMASSMQYDSGTTLYISSFNIHPSYRGKKVNHAANRNAAEKSSIGRFFFRESLARIRVSHPALKSIYLMVSSEWHGARKIYAEHGFRCIHTFDAYPGFGDVPVHIYRNEI